MAGLEKVNKGQKLRVKADSWNTFVDVANHVRQRMMNQNASAEKVTDDSSPFKNSSEYDMPQYGVGWLTDAAFQGLSVVTQPAYPGISRIVIASKPCAAGGVGAGWTEGLRPVRVSGWSTIAIGQRIGAQADSWDAIADPLGPMLVIGKLDEPLVLARITGQRGDCIVVDASLVAPSASGPYQHLRFDGLTVSQTQPGITVVGTE